MVFVSEKCSWGLSMLKFVNDKWYGFVLISEVWYRREIFLTMTSKLSTY